MYETLLSTIPTPMKTPTPPSSVCIHFMLCNLLTIVSATPGFPPNSPAALSVCTVWATNWTNPIEQRNVNNGWRERETWGRVAPCHLNKYWFHCQRHTEMTRHGLMFPANRSRRLTSPGYVTAHSSFAWRRRPSHTIARICNRRPRGLIDLLHQINASALGPISHSSTKQRQGCKMWAKRPDTG